MKLADGSLVKGRQLSPDVAKPTVQKAKSFDLPHYRRTSGTE